jgi:hypothetical protein
MFNQLFETVEDDVDDMSEDEAENIMQSHLED